MMMTKKWKDYRLQFPSFVDKDKVVLNIDWRKELWMPDIFFENSIDGNVQGTIIPNMYLWLFRNKTIQFTARYELYLKYFFNIQYPILHFNMCANCKLHYKIKKSYIIHKMFFSLNET